eukprot:scaffold443_cov177-Amphora_coffeaeformis.AAC.10
MIGVEQFRGWPRWDDDDDCDDLTMAAKKGKVVLSVDCRFERNSLILGRLRFAMVRPTNGKWVDSSHRSTTHQQDCSIMNTNNMSELVTISVSSNI